MPKHRLFFDRNASGVDGKLTLLRLNDDGTHEPVFKQVKARSGQAGFTHTNWVNSKSPIPYGDFWMTTTPVPLQMEPRNTPFFAIGSDPKNIGVIKIGKGKRTAIGLHKENRFKGSAGCIVIVNMDIADAMFEYIKNLNEAFIEVIVV